MTRDKSVRLLARSLFKELTAQGYDRSQVVSLATALLDELLAATQTPAEPAVARQGT